MHSENEAIPARVFVYGTLKIGGRLNCIMRELEATYIGTGSVYGYTLREMSGGAFPAAVPALDPRDCVEGEVWELPDGDTGLWVLDRFEGVPYVYMRLSNIDVVMMDETSWNEKVEKTYMYALARTQQALAGPIIGSYFDATNWGPQLFTE